MARLLKIDVFTDVVCPWCLVGSARLDQAISRLPDDIEVVIENHPFYLDPTVPPEGVDVAQMLKEKYGRDPKEMWARVEGEAKKAGIDLDLSQQPRMFNTAKAHTITRLSKANGNQHELANAIGEAYSLDHQQIDDDNTLADVAVKIRGSGRGLNAYVASTAEGARLVVKGTEGEASAFTIVGANSGSTMTALA